MNRVKYRPVGTPSAQPVIVKITQSKNAIWRLHGAPGGLSLRLANKGMRARGFVRARP